MSSEYTDFAGVIGATSGSEAASLPRADRMLTTEPLLPTVGVLALVLDRQGLWWQPRHHILTRLSRFFHVVWVSPSHEWRQTLRRILTPRRVEIEAPPGFMVYTPEPWLPVVYRPAWLGRTSLRARLNRAKNLLRKKGCRHIVLYIWFPEFLSALRHVSHDLSCYHIDDEYSFSPVDLPNDPVEAALIASVDQVFIHSRTLLEKKGALNPHTTLVPNGVDYAAYATPQPEPSDLASIAAPRIGYTGHLKRQLNWSLLFDLASRHAQWSFVLVGAPKSHPEVKTAIQRLSCFPNVHFLGGKSTDALARYPQHFDVCIMPYQLDGYTKYIYPMKLHEYLATGRPVVGAQIPTLEEFRDVVNLPATSEAWSAALADALLPGHNTEARRAARQAVARQFDWNCVTSRIAKVMAQRLGLAFPEDDHGRTA